VYVRVFYILEYYND